MNPLHAQSYHFTNHTVTLSLRSQYLLFIIFLFSYVAALRLTLLLALLHQSAAVSWPLKYLYDGKNGIKSGAVEVLDGCLNG